MNDPFLYSHLCIRKHNITQGKKNKRIEIKMGGSGIFLLIGLKDTRSNLQRGYINA